MEYVWIITDDGYLIICNYENHGVGKFRGIMFYSTQEEDKEEMKEILEMKRTHDKLYKKRQARLLAEEARKNAALGKDFETEHSMT